jgi:hypothetical protein
MLCQILIHAETTHFLLILLARFILDVHVRIPKARALDFCCYASALHWRSLLCCWPMAI